MDCVVRGIPVAYEEVGSGRPLLMLHGRPGDHRLMSHNLEPILEARRGWRRLYPDLPGMGRTPAADWIHSQDEILDVVLGFLDSVAPRERFALAAASYGGYLARGILAKRAPEVDGLFLWAPAVSLGDAAARRLPTHHTLVHDPATVADLSPDERAWLGVSVVQSPATLAAFRDAVKPGLLAADQAFMERVAARDMFSFDLAPAGGPFPGPTLVVCGRQDAICGYADAWELLENLPRATFAVLDRAGHGLAAEQPALFRVLVSEWLDRVEEYIAR